MTQNEQIDRLIGEIDTLQEEQVKKDQDQEDLIFECRSILMRSFQYTKDDANYLIRKIFSTDPPTSTEEFITRVFRRRE